MDDEEYARELYAILTGPPDPDVPPHELQPDWIDRQGGFGTEVQVASVAVVPGPYGSQIEVGFVLVVPEGFDVPAEGSALLPVDAEWRRLSGYDAPEDYAPVIAAQLERVVRNHVAKHTERPSRGYDPPDREAQHATLLHVLGREGEVEEPSTDRYVVRREGGHDLTAILTPAEWEQVLRRHGPPKDGTFDHYDELFGSTPPGEPFLVFWEGELRMSVREKLPPVQTPRPPMREVKRRLAEAKASGKEFGWFAYSRRTED